MNEHKQAQTGKHPLAGIVCLTRNHKYITENLTNMSAATIINTTVHNGLTVQKAFTEYQQEVKELSTYAWLIVYSALWNGRQYNNKEIDEAKAHIQSFLQQGNSHNSQYRQFVQRVLLARNYLNSHPGKYSPRPGVWFSSKNNNGFDATAAWFNSVQQTREQKPFYKQSLAAFPKAISETIQTGNANRFHYWRSYFIQQKANGLLNLYLATIANYKRINP